MHLTQSAVGKTSSAIFASRPSTKVAMICDYREELWYSMDLVADMLLDEFEDDLAGEVLASRIQPDFVRLFRAFKSEQDRSRARNAERFLNRVILYPRYLNRLKQSDFDLFHILDHSYSQLCHYLPAQQVLVTCHDLDAFASLLDPASEPRPAWYRALSRHILSGFQSAAHVVCVSHTVRNDAIRYGLIRSENSCVVYNGVHRTYSPYKDVEADNHAADLLPFSGEVPLILHVGSVIPRKRIDLLLKTFERIIRFVPAKLVRVGGPLSMQQVELAKQLGVYEHIVQLPFLEQHRLAAIYRRSDVLVMTSEREGFGLPLVEAMACACPAVTSDIPVLREIGGACTEYVSSADAGLWGDTLLRLIDEKRTRPAAWTQRQNACVERSARFSWEKAARDLGELYRSII